MKTRLFLALALIGTHLGAISAAADETVSEGEWISLFDGISLAGWSVQCVQPDPEKSFWTVTDGPQIDINPGGPWRNGFIYDETREAKQWVYPIVGPPAKAKPEHATKGWTWKTAEEGDGWNDVHILCEGTRIQVIINGVLLSDYEGSGYLDNEDHRKHRVGMNGHIALQIHRGNDPRVRFRDIQLKRL